MSLTEVCIFDVGHYLHRHDRPVPPSFGFSYWVQVPVTMGIAPVQTGSSRDAKTIRGHHEKAPGALTPRAVSLMSHQLAKEDEQKLNKGKAKAQVQ
jgi:hypothetical protein